MLYCILPQVVKSPRVYLDLLDLMHDIFLQYSQIVIIGASSLNYFQCTNDDKEGQSQLSVTKSSGCDTLHPGKHEEKVLYSVTTKDLEGFYSPLGEPDLKDLPSFAYQISQGMVRMCSKIYCTCYVLKCYCIGFVLHYLPN